jgi:kynurenine formamidase
MRIVHERMWDLSQPVAHDGPCWPEQTPPAIRHNERAAVGGFNVETIEMTDHTGTHVDAPFHHDDAAATIDRMPIETFAGPALFIDLRDRVEPSMEIGPEQDPRLEGVDLPLIGAACRR